MKVEEQVAKIVVMQLNDDDLVNFLFAYVAVCNETGITPLPDTILAAIAELILASAFPREKRLH